MSSLPNPLSLLHQFGFLQSTNWSLTSCPPLTHKVALITGGAGGIGAEITRQLLLHDISSVIVLARSQERFESARAEIWGAELGARVRFVQVDLADLEAVEKVGRMLAQELERLDMLFLNAGAFYVFCFLFVTTKLSTRSFQEQSANIRKKKKTAAGLNPKYTLSPQGVESVFATNHLGHHHLTQLLLPLLAATPQKYNVASTRIIVTSSSLHTLCRSIDFSTLTAASGSEGAYAGVSRYARAKLANILFTRALARRAPQNVYANVYFPGNIPTSAMDAWKGVVGPLGGVVGAVFRRVGQSLEDGAATAVFLAAAEEVEKGAYRGEYWVPVANIEACSNVAMDEGLAERLWVWSEEMAQRAKGVKGVPVGIREDGAGNVHLAHPTCLTPALM